jgi:imidazole glycerol-phosphate synthase subunit HisH
MLVVVDYGMGNLGSVENMLRKVGAPATVSADVEVVRRATRLILPGVGSFDAGMQNLEQRGLLPVLQAKVQDERVPVLGICLGMQLFSRRSEEGRCAGLGWLEADTVRIRPESAGPPLPVPHMGWDEIRALRPHPVLEGLETAARFYFVHSYQVRCDRAEDLLAVADYGGPVTAAVCRGNVVGTQFHPEKSHRFGMRLMKNWVEA